MWVTPLRLLFKNVASNSKKTHNNTPHRNINNKSVVTSQTATTTTVNYNKFLNTWWDRWLLIEQQPVSFVQPHRCNNGTCAITKQKQNKCLSLFKRKVFSKEKKNIPFYYKVNVLSNALSKVGNRSVTNQRLIFKMNSFLSLVIFILYARTLPLTAY